MEALVAIKKDLRETILNLQKGEWMLSQYEEILKSGFLRFRDKLTIIFIFHESKTDFKVFDKGNNIIAFGNVIPVNTDIGSISLTINDSLLVGVNYK